MFSAKDITSHFPAGPSSASLESLRRGNPARRDSSLTGTTLRTERFSSWSVPTAVNIDEDDWPEFSDFKMVDDELEDIEEAEENAVERSSSPVDPDLVFELGRAHLAVSGYPEPRKVEYDIADLTGQIGKIDDHAAAIGGCSDIWRGLWDVNGRCETVGARHNFFFA